MHLPEQVLIVNLGEEVLILMRYKLMYSTVLCPYFNTFFSENSVFLQNMFW
jgi:hypothetical protein